MKKSLGAHTLLCPAPVVLVGSYDPERKPNLMTVAWAGLCCSKPPCVAVSLRPATYSHGQLVRSGVFTVNIPSAAQVKEADFCGMASGRDRDKLAVLGWTETPGEHVDAPVVNQVPLCLECKVVHTLELGMHTMFVGQIMDVKADEEILGPDGKPDPAKLDPLAFLPERRIYWGMNKILGDAFALGKDLL